MSKNLKTRPLVSIIVPIFNSEKYIAQTITSVIEQTYTNWELFLINDGSTDKSEEIIKEFEKVNRRIYVINLKISSGGPAKPRNIGLEKSKGEYIAFLDNDDLWDKEKLSFQIEEISKNNLDIFCSSARVINQNNELIGELDKSKSFKFISSLFSTFNSLLILNPINISSSIVKKRNFLRFREDKQLQSIEDWAFWIDYLDKESKIKISDIKMSSYREHENSVSKINGKKQYYRGFVLYSLLLSEGMIGLKKFILLVVFHFCRTIIYIFKKK